MESSKQGMGRKAKLGTNASSRMRPGTGAKPDSDFDYSLPPRKLVRTMPPMITVRQAAATGIACDRQIRYMCAEGTIKSIKIGKDWRIYRDSFFEQFFFVAEYGPDLSPSARWN